MANPQDRNVAVLVVEDEYLIRMDTTSSLEAAGFIVYEAENAAEAIRCLELHSEIRLVFTDVNMPGTMDGWRSPTMSADDGLPSKSSSPQAI